MSSLTSRRSSATGLTAKQKLHQQQQQTSQHQSQQSTHRSRSNSDAITEQTQSSQYSDSTYTGTTDDTYETDERSQTSSYTQLTNLNQQSQYDLCHCPPLPSTHSHLSFFSLLHRSYTRQLQVASEAEAGLLNCTPHHCQSLLPPTIIFTHNNVEWFITSQQKHAKHNSNTIQSTILRRHRIHTTPDHVYHALIEYSTKQHTRLQCDSMKNKSSNTNSSGSRVPFSSSRCEIVAQFTHAAINASSNNNTSSSSQPTTIYLTQTTLHELLFELNYDWTAPRLQGTLQAFVLTTQLQPYNHVYRSTWTNCSSSMQQQQQQQLNDENCTIECVQTRAKISERHRSVAERCITFDAPQQEYDDYSSSDDVDEKKHQQSNHNDQSHHRHKLIKHLQIDDTMQQRLTLVTLTLLQRLCSTLTPPNTKPPSISELFTCIQLFFKYDSQNDKLYLLYCSAMVLMGY
jgi:hypothetical protein